MKKKTPAGVIADLGLPAEPPLGPEEAAGAVREARRISGHPSPPDADPAGDGATRDGAPGPLIPWGPLRPDEIPS